MMSYSRYETLVKLYPNESSYRLYLAQTYFKLEKFAEASKMAQGVKDEKYIAQVCIVCCISYNLGESIAVRDQVGSR